MSRHELTNTQWERIKPYLLKRRGGRGRPPADERTTLNGIIYVLKTGCAWMDMPKKYGSYATCWRKHRKYVQRKGWDRIWSQLLGDLYEEGKASLDHAHLDAKFVSAKKGDRELEKPGLARDLRCSVL
jgi:transposase